jgi:hypothetical protein
MFSFALMKVLMRLKVSDPATSRCAAKAKLAVFMPLLRFV